MPSGSTYRATPRLAVLLLMVLIRFSRSDSGDIRFIIANSYTCRSSITLLYFLFYHAARNEVSLINQCTCLGFSQTYECTIAAEGGSTIWKGTAIDCPEIGNEIFLGHSSQEFTQIRGCFSRPITAYGVRIEENCYTSRLNITTLDLNMNNESVQCIYSNGTSTVVGTAYIEISTGTHTHAHTHTHTCTYTQ